MKKLVVVGGGFSGAYVARKLEKHFQVTLIDNKDYFEFTPGILRTIVDPSHASKIEVKHSDYLTSTRILNDKVIDIHQASLETEKSEKINFDYLAICTGSRYETPMKETNLVIADRGKKLKEGYENLCRAKKVLVIGGGLVGVELAAEIAEHYDDKEITIVHNKSRLIDRQPEKASKYAEIWLKEKNVRVIFNENLILSNKKEHITDKKTKIEADIVFLCTGIRPNYEIIAKCFKESLVDKSFIGVNSFMQLKGYENIFVAGDVTGIREEKTAQNAEKQAKIVVSNLKRLDEGKKLREYQSKDRIMVINLGNRSGILSYKGKIITGIIPGMLKKFIELKTMINYR